MFLPIPNETCGATTDKEEVMAKTLRSAPMDERCPVLYRPSSSVFEAVIFRDVGACRFEVFPTAPKEEPMPTYQ